MNKNRSQVDLTGLPGDKTEFEAFLEGFYEQTTTCKVTKVEYDADRRPPKTRTGQAEGVSNTFMAFHSLTVESSVGLT